MKRILFFNWLPERLSFLQRLVGYLLLWIIPFIFFEVYTLTNGQHAGIRNKLSGCLIAIPITPVSEILGFERFFAEITNKAIRRGCFYSVDDLVETIENYLKVNNEAPKPFKWTASAESIIEKVGRCRAIYETLH